MTALDYKITRTAAVSGGQVWVGWQINYKDAGGRSHTFIVLSEGAANTPPDRDGVHRAIETYEGWKLG